MNDVAPEYVAVLFNNGLAFKNNQVFIARPGDVQGLGIGRAFAFLAGLPVMGGVAGGFNPADTLLVAVKYHPIRVQPGFALNQFDSAGVNGRSGAFIQAGRICTDLYGDIGIQVECRCRAGQQCHGQNRWPAERSFT